MAVMQLLFYGCTAFYGYYNALFKAKNGDIGLGNSYFWEVYDE